MTLRGSGVSSPRHIVTDDTSLGAHFQDFKVAAGVIPGNAWHNTVLTERCSLTACEVSLTYKIRPNDDR